jgi:serine/threonine protein kinase
VVKELGDVYGKVSFLCEEKSSGVLCVIIRDLFSNIVNFDNLKSIPSPYVVKYIDSFVFENSRFYVLEYCEKGNLRVFIDKRKSKNSKIPEKVFFWYYFDFVFLKAVRKILTHLVHGMYCLYEKEISNRRINPDNVLIGKEFTFKLGLFGEYSSWILSILHLS